MVRSTNGFNAIVDSLCCSNGKDGTSVLRGPRRQPLPSRDVIASLVEDLRSALFPGYYGTSELSTESMHYHVGSTLDGILRLLKEQIRRGFCFVCNQDSMDRCPDCEIKALKYTHAFYERLPDVQRMLSMDVQAAYEGDPAATSPDETVFCYPGLLAITNYRLAHELHRFGIPLIPRIITELAHSLTGIDIHPGAAIGEAFFIDHGTGVVVGETCRIGKNVRIYQGVTLGAKSFPLDEHGKPVKGVPRHPLVEDDVIIYSGATILGRVTIGKGAVVGGNVWLTRDVAAGSRVSQAESRQERWEWGGGI
ncbi:MAG: serine acetyltransferase [Deltaproteobacteria bacterium]|nr:serine acetyltransferase [Deltaproteobacteria bacterium]